jgi:predicted DNA-binding transcriptional regulator YafY
MSQRQQLERIMEIDRQIRASLYPKAEDIAAVIECSRRVIFEDKRFMVDRLGAPIEFDRERGGWYYTDPTWILPNTMVTEGELLAYLLSIEVAQRHVGTAFESPLRSAIEKISKTIKGSVTVDLEQLRAYYSVANPTTAINEQVLLDLYKAAQERRQVRMNYYSNTRGEWNVRTVNPHHLYFENDAWYLFAFDHLRGEMRNFHLGRIEWWEVLDERFERSPGFSADDWMGQAFQGIRGEESAPVAIQFDPYQARWIRERNWPDTHQIEELPGGGLILRFETTGLEGVKLWVMQYGRHAEVLAPPELRAQVAEELRLAMERYSADSKGLANL